MPVPASAAAVELFCEIEARTKHPAPMSKHELDLAFSRLRDALSAAPLKDHGTLFSAIDLLETYSANLDLEAHRIEPRAGCQCPSCSRR